MGYVMGTKVKIELVSSGIAELLNSAEIGGECKKAADAIAATAGEGFEVSSAWHANFGGGRVAYSVKAATREARIAEADDKVLSKAVGANAG